MTTVTFYTTGRDTVKIKAHGHAGSNAPGSDLVCGIVSVLIQGLANELECHGLLVDREECPAAAEIILEFKPAPVSEALTDFVYHILTSFEQDYEKYIDVKITDL